MKPLRREDIEITTDPTEVLLHELREECEHVVQLIRQLEAKPKSQRVRDELLGELSAAVLHLHVHTEGLDAFLCETP